MSRNLSFRNIPPSVPGAFSRYPYHALTFDELTHQERVVAGSPTATGSVGLEELEELPERSLGLSGVITGGLVQAEGEGLSIASECEDLELESRIVVQLE